MQSEWFVKNMNQPDCVTLHFLHSMSILNKSIIINFENYGSIV